MRKPYRTQFGLDLPPEGTGVSIKFMAGSDFYIVWNDCPDAENILYGWMKKKAEAIEVCISHGWKIILK